MQTKQPTSRPAPQPTDAVKETAESVVVAFILAFVFRLFVIEAFIIPTGSMAPTLLGRHLSVTCPQCGYAHDLDGGEQRPAPGEVFTALCPMCRFPIEGPAPQFDRSGDRILVQKYLYAWAEPRRFDVVVFKNPQDPFGESGTYIKRLAGLPDESLMILDGNVYTRPFAETQWRIARKVDPSVNPRWERIQRSVWQPVYHSEYVPLDGGESDARGERYRWHTPWRPDRDALKVDGLRAYRFEPTPEMTEASLRFEFKGPGTSIRDYASESMRYPYNQVNQWSGHREEPMEDVRLSALVTPQGPSAVVTMQSSLRFQEGPVPVRVNFRASGSQSVSIERMDGDAWEVLGTAELSGMLRAGRGTMLEAWVVDQTLIAWVDGREVLRYAFEVPFKTLLSRAGPVSPYANEVWIGVSGPAMTLERVGLDRDLYYGSERDYASGGVRGGVARSIRGGTMLAGFEPVVLGEDEFFFLGDNSPHSQDGRQWTDVDPWVRHRYFAEQDSPEGKVPRELLLGRAFLVYYPSPLPLNHETWAVVPNLGDIRRID